MVESLQQQQLLTRCRHILRLDPFMAEVFSVIGTQRCFCEKGVLIGCGLYGRPPQQFEKEVRLCISW